MSEFYVELTPKDMADLIDGLTVTIKGITTTVVISGDAPDWDWKGKDS